MKQRRTQGWLAASTFAVVTTPRLLAYLLMAILAGLRRPPGEAGATPSRPGGAVGAPLPRTGA